MVHGPMASQVVQMVRESAWNPGAPGSAPGLGRSSREGSVYPLQHSCLKNTMDGGAWQATVHGGHKESDTTEQLGMHKDIF